ncbi:hypothetical protein MUN88_06700 [Gracilibacillus caseinilyticus]|uniref:Trypsin n=1 Tax=Gracilibacillus caseinilyticus TaxID=2932256 RepID=A0ABY4EZC7_9BACI|nr:hypothetical protein [Gracilibacillus caseinilyticus]UOQ49763.1 hypothetical protein MUN88_06700 [Gracilibacillus caseinilyticus]
MSSEQKKILHCLGKIEFWFKKKKSFGSASIIRTTSIPIVVTAAHCLYDWDDQSFYKDVSFYPYIDGLKTKIKPRMAVIPKLWATQGALDYDTGFLTFESSSTIHEYHTHAISAAFNLPPELTYFVTGFENKIIPSQKPFISHGKAQEDTYMNSTLQGVNSKYKSGMSGGAWVTKYQGQFVQNSVTSLSFKSVKNVLWGPYWGKTIESVFKVASGCEEPDSSVLTHRYNP